MPNDNPSPTGDAEADAEIDAILASGGPVWIPAAVANAEMERMLAEAEDAEDARALQEWDDLNASGPSLSGCGETPRSPWIDIGVGA